MGNSRFRELGLVKKSKPIEREATITMMPQAKATLCAVRVLLSMKDDPVDPASKTQ